MAQSKLFNPEVGFGLQGLYLATVPAGRTAYLLFLRKHRDIYRTKVQKLIAENKTLSAEFKDAEENLRKLEDYYSKEINILKRMFYPKYLYKSVGNSARAVRDFPGKVVRGTVSAVKGTANAAVEGYWTTRVYATACQNFFKNP